MSKEQVKKLNSPFAPNGFKAEALPCDKEYKSIQILDCVKKTGDGEQDFIIDKKVEVTLQPIRDVVDADKDKVGVYAVLKQFMRTGDQTLIPRDDGNCNVDLVGAPESLIDVDRLGKEAEQKFTTIPEELRGELDMEKFVESMSQEKFDAFVKAVADRSSKKSEVKENGE